MKFYFTLEQLINWKVIVVFIGLSALISCSTSQKVDRLYIAQQLAVAKGWEEYNLSSAPYPLRSYLSPHSVNSQVLTIYIEGDGSSWDYGQYPSSDPTPKDPIALKLALAQPSGTVAYLARSCQFIREPTLCHQGVWTSGRFSQLSVEAADSAINILKRKTGAKKIVLVGYSGGAAIALLLAAQRIDIELVVTVAGNVNPHLWANNLGLEPLTDSLDPRQAIPLMVSTPQLYFIGLKDQVLSPELTMESIKLFPSDHRPALIEIAENGHVCCWVEQWPVLWSQYIQRH